MERGIRDAEQVYMLLDLMHMTHDARPLNGLDLLFSLLTSRRRFNVPDVVLSLKRSTLLALEPDSMYHFDLNFGNVVCTYSKE